MKHPSIFPRRRRFEVFGYDVNAPFEVRYEWFLQACRMLKPHLCAVTESQHVQYAMAFTRDPDPRIARQAERAVQAFYRLKRNGGGYEDHDG